MLLKKAPKKCHQADTAPENGIKLDTAPDNFRSNLVGQSAVNYYFILLFADYN